MRGAFFVGCITGGCTNDVNLLINKLNCSCFIGLATDEGADTVAKAALQYGAIDILVNNARATSHKLWEDTTTQDWMEMYNLNVVRYRTLYQMIPAGLDSPKRSPVQ